MGSVKPFLHGLGVRVAPLPLTQINKSTNQQINKTQTNVLLFVFVLVELPVKVVLLLTLKRVNMTEDITPQNIYQDEDIYANLSDKELKDLYEDLEADYWVSRMKEE